MDFCEKLVVRHFIERVVNTGDLERIADYITPDAAEEMTRHISAVRSTYPDLQVTIKQQIAEGDVVVTRIVARGTHKGIHFGIPSTNKEIAIEGVNIDRIVNGRIVEHWGAANTLEALIAIGALRLGPNGPVASNWSLGFITPEQPALYFDAPSDAPHRSSVAREYHPPPQGR